MSSETATSLTIADAARVSGVSAHTLRYYERAGLLDGVDREAGSGTAATSEADLAWIQVADQSCAPPGCRSGRSASTPSWCREGDGNEAQRLALLRSTATASARGWPRWSAISISSSTRSRYTGEKLR